MRVERIYATIGESAASRVERLTLPKARHLATNRADVPTLLTRTTLLVLTNEMLRGAASGSAANSRCSGDHYPSIRPCGIRLQFRKVND